MTSRRVKGRTIGCEFEYELHPRELELTPMGDLWLVDPETGRHFDDTKAYVDTYLAHLAAESGLHHH